MNRFGNQLRLSIFGESHGHGIGITLDGIPPGLPIDPAIIQADLDRRRPGTSHLTSARNEPDQPQILTGTYQDKTTGAPLTIWIKNQDTRSRDYSQLTDKPRPGHSDYIAHIWSHGHGDHRGGGHYSGRLTAPLVAAAAIIRPLLTRHGIDVAAHLHQVHDITAPPHTHDAATMHAAQNSPVFTAHKELETQFVTRIEEARNNRDSVGGIIEYIAQGVPPALGDPFFDSVESHIAHILFAIPAVKGVDFGAGFTAATMHGSQHNDPYTPTPDGGIQVTKNDAGGILGGRTTGAPIRGRIAIKPTSSIFQPQDTVDLKTGQATTLELKGRHDPCIAIRAVPVARAAVELALADLILLAYQQGHLNPHNDPGEEATRGP